MIMEKKKLYPILFKPETVERPWGSEVWTVADMGVADSEIANGWLSGNSMSDLMETYLERVVGENVYQFYGRQFPVLVKFADICKPTPVSVHPDDSIAMERYDALGKAKLWYVTEASSDAKIYLGFKCDVTAQEFFDKCMDGSILELMNEFTPVKGQHILIEPGTVHATTGKLKLVCISEASEVNFYPYNPYIAEGEEDTGMIHISEALDFINFKKYEFLSTDSSEVIAPLVDRPEFNVSRINLSDPLHIYTEKIGSFIVYACAEGEASVQVPVGDSGDKKMENYVLKCGEAMLIPAELPDFYLVPRDRNTILLEVVTNPGEDVDEYIDPSTEPFLEGEDYGGLEDEEFDEDAYDEQSEEE